MELVKCMLGTLVNGELLNLCVHDVPIHIAAINNEVCVVCACVVYVHVV